MEKKAEAKTGMSDMANVLKYIESKEGTLSGYTDKLRRSIKSIDNLFNTEIYCRFCGYTNNNVTHNNHPFKSAIAISINIIDTKPFYIYSSNYNPELEMRDTKYYLAFENKILKVQIVEEDSDLNKTTFLPNLSRKAIKSLIHSGRIIYFLKAVAKKLKKTNKEYKEVSEIADKVAKSIIY